MTAHRELETEIEALYTIWLDEENLTEWEYNFIENIKKRFDAGQSLSADQVAKIEELYDRFDERGLI